MQKANIYLVLYLKGHNQNLNDKQLNHALVSIIYINIHNIWKQHISATLNETYY